MGCDGQDESEAVDATQDVKMTKLLKDFNDNFAKFKNSAGFPMISSIAAMRKCIAVCEEFAVLSKGGGFGMEEKFATFLKQSDAVGLKFLSQVDSTSARKNSLYAAGRLSKRAFFRVEHEQIGEVQDSMTMLNGLLSNIVAVSFIARYDNSFNSWERMKREAVSHLEHLSKATGALEAAATPTAAGGIIGRLFHG